MAMSWTSTGLLGTRKCSQRIGVHALSGCDTVSYPFGKGNKWTLKLMGKEIPGLNQVDIQAHGERDTWSQTSGHSSSWGKRYLVSIKWTLKLMGKEIPGLNQVLTDFCGQKSCTIMNDAHAHVLHCRKKTPTN